MNFKNILLDIESVNQGLPPMSLSDLDVADAILSLSPEDKRAATRKIRKICKKHLKTIKCIRRRNDLRINLGLNGERPLFNKVALLRRIRLSRRCLEFEIDTKKL